MSLLMGPAPRNNGNKGITPKVTSSSPAADRRPINKFVKVAHEVMNTLDFNHTEAALGLTRLSIPVQKQFIKVCMLYFYALSNRLDNANGMTTAEEYDLYIRGKRVHEALIPFDDL